MIAPTAGCENKLGQDTVSLQASVEFQRKDPGSFKLIPQLDSEQFPTLSNNAVKFLTKYIEAKIGRASCRERV